MSRTWRRVGAPWLPSLAAAVACGALLVAPASAESGSVAKVHIAKSAIKWEPAVEFDRLVLSVSGPGVDLRREFGAGEAPYLESTSKQHGRLPDGAYSYELVVQPAMSPGMREKLAAARDAADRGLKVDLAGIRPEGGTPTSQSGHFSVVEGAFVVPGEEEPGRRTKQTGELRVEGNIEAGGAKSFVAADPANGGRLVYAALEGPEAGTYHRGSARTTDGVAVIELPDHFGAVTEAEGLTVQLTPAGGWSRLYVVEKSLERLVVHSADGGAIAFDYLVQGVRKGYAGFQVEQPLVRIVPETEGEER